MSVDERRVSLLQLAEQCLAQSRLIFLVADLRLLSSTGRINTRFDALALDSDRFLRTTYKGMACLTSGETRRGITPSHVMAILLLEMNQSMTEQRKDPVDQVLDDDPLSWHEEEMLRNLKISRSDPRVAKKAEGDLHALLQSYVQTMRLDLMDDIPKVPHRLFATANISASPSDLNDTPNPPVFSSLFGADGGISDQTSPRPRASTMDSVGAYIFASVTDAVAEDICGQDELVKLLRHGISKRDVTQLGFLETFFREGTVTKMMARSKAEIVWLHDWHLQKECTYAISIDREKKIVMVIFRGASTVADWDHSVRWSSVKVDNPIQGEYENKTSCIKLHGGYYRYLFRKRKDTKTTKYDEIAAKVQDYGAMIGEDYRLVVTGHSLGGALSNIFSFFASLEERFTKNYPIQAVTFGCPRMSGYQFADAIRYQEDAGLLQIARFRNIKDAITHLPPLLFQYSKRGAKYYHVGLEVALPLIRKSCFKMCGQPEPRPKFLDPEEWWPSYRRQWRESYFFNLPVRPWMLSYFHTLMEHQQRMLLAKPDSSLATLSLTEFYEKRSEFTSNWKHSLLREKEEEKDKLTAVKQSDA